MGKVAIYRKIADNNSLHFYDWLYVIISGVLTSISYSNEKCFWLCFFSLIPFYYVLLKKEYSLKQYTLLIYAFSPALFVPSVSWLSALEQFLPYDGIRSRLIMAGAVILVALIEGSYIFLSTVFFKYVKRERLSDVFILSALFVLSEWLMEYTPLPAFPWIKAGVIVSPFTAFIQSASLFGVYFTSFLVILINALCAYCIINIKSKKTVLICVIISVCLFSINTLYGAVRIKAQKNKTYDSFDALIVQGNFPDNEKWNQSVYETIFTYINLSRQGKTPQTKIIVWPETALPITYCEGDFFDSWIKETAHELNCIIITGIFTQEKDKAYNTALAFLPDRTTARPYLKCHLAPFGEFIPFEKTLQNVFPSLFECFGSDSLASGKGSHSIIDTPAGKIGAMICYDSVFTDMSLKCSSEGAQIIALMTNDSWFGDTRALYQHHCHAVMRAVESDRYILRASNTGISSIISPCGEAEEIAQKFISTYARKNVYIKNTRTLYSLTGPIIIIPCLAVFVYTVIKTIKTRIERKGV